MKKKPTIVLMLAIAVIAVAGLLWWRSERSKQAVDDAIQQAVDACGTGNKLLLDERVVHAHSVFRTELSIQDAYNEENVLSSKLAFIGCKGY